MDHGKRIHSLVKEKKYSNKEIAALLDIHPKYMYKLYKQEVVTYKILQKVAKLFKKNVHYFFENGATENEVNENFVEYGQTYIKKYIKSLEDQVELLKDDNLRLTEQVKSLKNKKRD
jgi:transcriptional regulator with XRE-family HTH domain